MQLLKRKQPKIILAGTLALICIFLVIGFKMRVFGNIYCSSCYKQHQVNFTDKKNAYSKWCYTDVGFACGAIYRCDPDGTACGLTAECWCDVRESPYAQ